MPLLEKCHQTEPPLNKLSAFAYAYVYAMLTYTHTDTYRKCSAVAQHAWCDAYFQFRAQNANCQSDSCIDSAVRQLNICASTTTTQANSWNATRHGSTKQKYAKFPKSKTTVATASTTTTSNCFCCCLQHSSCARAKPSNLLTLPWERYLLHVAAAAVATVVIVIIIIIFYCALSCRHMSAFVAVMFITIFVHYFAVTVIVLLLLLLLVACTAVANFCHFFARPPTVCNASGARRRWRSKVRRNNNKTVAMTTNCGVACHYAASTRVYCTGADSWVRIHTIATLVCARKCIVY